VIAVKTTGEVIRLTVDNTQKGLSSAPFEHRVGTLPPGTYLITVSGPNGSDSVTVTVP
jgi:hypothetical protein